MNDKRTQDNSSSSNNPPPDPENSPTIFVVNSNSPDLEKCLEIRKVVFIDGQNVPEELEIDGLDGDSVHYMLVLSNEPIGTARVRYSDTKAKIERVAILPEHQGQGFGQQLMRFIIEDIKRAQRAKKIALSSQTQAIVFYENLGFVVCSSEYMDANIPHKDMEMAAQSKPR